MRISTDEGQGQALVLICGMLCDEALFASQRVVLSSGYRVLCAIPDGGATMEEEAQELLELLKQKRLQNFAIGGLSMGGYLAQLLAIHHPENLNGMVLLNTRCGADTEFARQGRQECIQGLHEGRFESLMQAFMNNLLAPDSLQNAQLCTELRSMFRRMGAGVWERQQRTLLSRQASCDQLEKLNLPCTVIGSAGDRLCPPLDMRELAVRIPGACWRLLPGNYGHLSTVEAPKTSTRQLLEFMSQLPR